MNKVIVYIISIVGLGLMVVGFGMLKLSFLEGIDSNYISIAGVVLVAIGVFLSLKGEGGRRGRKVASGEDEVPIYEGTGKKRRVVGYRKD